MGRRRWSIGCAFVATAVSCGGRSVSHEPGSDQTTHGGVGGVTNAGARGGTGGTSSPGARGGSASGGSTGGGVGGGAATSAGAVGGTSGGAGRGGMTNEGARNGEGGASAASGRGSSGAAGAATAGVGAAAGVGANAGHGGTAPLPDWDWTNVEPDAAVAYQIDAAHSGAQLGSVIAPPLALAWHLDFDGPVSYPLIVGSRVFVSWSTLAPGGVTQAPVVAALDAATGAIVWQTGFVASTSPAELAGLAYDRGRVFISVPGRVLAADAETGEILWEANVGSGSRPVALGGAVYVGLQTDIGPGLAGLNEADGSVLFVVHSLGQPPTLCQGDALTSSGCFEADGVDLKTGSQVLHWPAECATPGVGSSTVCGGGYLLMLEAPGSFASLDVFARIKYKGFQADELLWPPNFDDQGPLFVNGTPGVTTLLRTDWSFNPLWSVAIGTDWPRLPMLVTPGYAYVLFGGRNEQPAVLHAIDLENRMDVWHAGPTDELPFDVEHASASGIGEFEGMAAGGGRVVLAFDHTLAAYAPAPEH